MAQTAMLQCCAAEGAASGPAPGAAGAGAAAAAARRRTARRRPARGLLRLGAAALALGAWLPPQRCWQAASPAGAEAGAGAPGGAQPGRRAAVLAAAAGTAPPLGPAAGARAEEPPLEEPPLEEPLGSKVTGFSRDRMNKIEPDDLVRAMPDDEYFKAVTQLTALQRNMALGGKDEKPFSGKTVNGYKWNSKEEGVYVSAISGVPLFSSAARYDAGDGQLSFWAPMSAKDIIERLDFQDKKTLPENECRIQLVDRFSKTHLGHVFGDGPEPSGKRYRVNAAALRFVPGPAPAGESAQALAGWKMK